ncbi:response regulator [Butyrivibrio sp. JL13D10]|uniref:response regulator n=1 Tax=Butyrivibrio sp. JL13D10 TaxID=3236815 RepID=UPI0038B69750
MPDRFMKSKFLIRTLYVLILFSLIGLMFYVYFSPGFLILHHYGLMFNFSYIPFIAIAALYGYYLALNAYLILFITAIFVDGDNTYLLTAYMALLFLYSMFSQYRWFRSKIKTVLAFVISYLVSLFFEFFNHDMILAYDFTSGSFDKFFNHASTPMHSCILSCIFFYLFFNHAPDFVKRIFPLGYMYTREYVENLLFQNSLKKTKLSIKITSIIIIEALLLGSFSIVFINILFPDLRHMMNDGLQHAQRLSDDMIFRYNNYGLAFTVKLMFMELSIAVPIASTINYYSKTMIGTPIGQLASYMLKFTDTTDENRTEYLQTVKASPINTHDEITELYYAMMITLNEVTGYIERIQEEQRLKEDLRVAEAASEAKSSFLSNMSHEIRTPINAVLGMNEMILRESDEQQTIEYANTIQSAGNTLLSLVNDILDFSKIEAGKMEILPVQYNLSSVINDLVNMISRRASDKGLELKVVVDEDIPDLLYGDEIRIKQCATNILTNAVKYTEKGSVTLEFSYKEMADSSIALTVRVVDTGIGIKEEDIQKLYSPFERIEEIRNRSIEGTGLGMSIVKKLLALMDTRLVVKSVYGEGSDFSFTVLQKVCDPEPIGDFEKRYKETVSTRKAYHESFTAPSARILVVDDTSMNLTVIKGLLKKTLVQIKTAQSGKEALRLVTDEKYDLIFLDHRMPEMDGIETLAAMKELPDNLNNDTICIALTANAVAGAREYYLDAGFADYISKPIDPARLENMLIQYLPAEKVALAGDSDNAKRDAGLDGNSGNSMQDAGFEGISGSSMQDAGLEEDSGNSIRDASSGGNSPAMRKLKEFKGIDIDVAIRNCGDEELALEVIEDFKSNLSDKYKMIKEYESAGDIKNFTIQVHSLKSSARIIGAEALSEQAEALEMLGNKWLDSKLDSNDKNEEYAGSADSRDSIGSEIRSNTVTLLHMLDDCMKAFGLEQADAIPDRNLPLIASDELASAFDNIRELMEAFDYDNAAAIYNMLSDYTIPAEMSEKYKLVGKYIASVDREKLLEVL